MYSTKSPPPNFPINLLACTNKQSGGKCAYLRRQLIWMYSVFKTNISRYSMEMVNMRNCGFYYVLWILNFLPMLTRATCIFPNAVCNNCGLQDERMYSVILKVYKIFREFCRHFSRIPRTICSLFSCYYISHAAHKILFFSQRGLVKPLRQECTSVTSESCLLAHTNNG